jgi:hypothetical protein
LVKHFKEGNGHRRSAALWSTENCCNWASQRNCTAVGVEHRAVQEWLRFWDIEKFVPVGLPVCLRVQRNTRRLGTALTSTLHSRFGPLRLPLVRPLKDHLRGHHYETDEAVQEDVRTWLSGAETDFYCIQSLRFCNAGRNA